ncbi:MAG: acetyl-CoA carboxylase carboxyltransferase subunit alpha [Gemmatimonadetes bacterium]|nr:acetyl-CoA carboxylase carboxyltransferase subunit alpha [Gemmatimonadota bacterium]
MSATPLRFEQDIAELERQIERLQVLAQQQGLDVAAELSVLERKLDDLKRETYRRLSAVERVALARHPKRPYTLDYIALAFSDFVELHGDRAYRDDEAIVGGWARLDGRTLMVIGHQKGRDMKENLRRNFGMPHPEGYRKALRLMQLAEKFRHPIVTLIDTPGAYPGIGAEERGQAEAIARNLREMARLRTPIVAAVIGEGGSGGALALGVADRILMLENAIYSVISPEGCAAILWKTPAARDQAAEALKLTATDLAGLGIVDEVIAEPTGGAHAEPEDAARRLREALLRHLDELSTLDPAELRQRRWAKYEGMGAYRVAGRGSR